VCSSGAIGSVLLLLLVFVCCCSVVLAEIGECRRADGCASCTLVSAGVAGPVFGFDVRSGHVAHYDGNKRVVGTSLRGALAPGTFQLAIEYPFDLAGKVLDRITQVRESLLPTAQLVVAVPTIFSDTLLAELRTAIDFGGLPVLRVEREAAAALVGSGVLESLRHGFAVVFNVDGFSPLSMQDGQVIEATLFEIGADGAAKMVATTADVDKESMISNVSMGLRASDILAKLLERGKIDAKQVDAVVVSGNGPLDDMQQVATAFFGKQPVVVDARRVVSYGAAAIGKRLIAKPTFDCSAIADRSEL
jgi:hypothetical protein